MAHHALQSGASTQGVRGEVPDDPIDYSVQYASRVKGAARHFGFFPFFAKKPWPVVQEYIRHYSRPGDLVCDPFAGSGVTAVEALVLGRRAVTSDINPVARFITHTTAVSPVNIEALTNAYDEIEASARGPIESLDALSLDAVNALLEDLSYPRQPIPPGVRRAGLNTVDQLHTPRQLAGLTLLRDVINQVPDSTLRDLLKVALANTVRYANRMYNLPSDKGRRRSPYRGDVGFLRRFSYSPASEKAFYEHSVWLTFDRVFRSVVDAKRETNRLIGDRYNEANFRVSDVPASRFHEVTGERSVDYVFTDPPYANDIRFLGLSTLWAAWLDLEITDESRMHELSDMPPSGEAFRHSFATSMESIGRVLKDDHWFTLVYKHKDLSLWQDIVAMCEAAGLRYINAVWQGLNIRSTRQVENPATNPSGDMYLNFRKMSQQKFETVYGRPATVDIPTEVNYVEREVERLIVADLGASIRVIQAGVVQQILDSRSFLRYRDAPDAINDDIRRVLDGPRFTTWTDQDGGVYWIMAPGVSLDSSLDPTERARYRLFDLLRDRGQLTEGQARAELLSELAAEPQTLRSRIDIPSLLHELGTPTALHHWEFDGRKFREFKQLRLFFTPSRADELREQLEQRSQLRPLHVDLEGMSVLRERLRAANVSNRQFDAQYARLADQLQGVLWRLRRLYGNRIELVTASGKWAAEGVDLRELSAEELILTIVVRDESKDFDLYWGIGQDVFADVAEGDPLIQFEIMTLSEWNRAYELAQAWNRDDEQGIVVVSRG